MEVWMIAKTHLNCMHSNAFRSLTNKAVKRQRGREQESERDQIVITAFIIPTVNEICLIKWLLKNRKHWSSLKLDQNLTTRLDHRFNYNERRETERDRKKTKTNKKNGNCLRPPLIEQPNFLQQWSFEPFRSGFYRMLQTHRSCLI